MNTLGWILILAAILLVRSVYKGRVFQIGEDLSDAFLALINSDTAQLKEVLDRSGQSNTPSTVDLNLFSPAFNAIGGAGVAVGQGIGQSLDRLESGLGSSVGLAAIVLGERAKGYRWGATGPDYYDCSGLMWKAMVGAKVYTGKRFTTDSFASMTKAVYRKVPGPPVIDDIVVWPFRVPYSTGHMGVVTGPDKFYSARSVRSGIGETSIKNFRKDTPLYYRRATGPEYGPPAPGRG